MQADDARRLAQTEAMTPVEGQMAVPQQVTDEPTMPTSVGENPAKQALSDPAKSEKSES